MEFYSDFSNIIPKYDAYILDLWGVIHDGTTLYSCVIETLHAIRKDGGKIVFLSNAPRRAGRIETVLNNFGITADLYDGIMSSGEAGFHFLKTSHGQAYYYFGPKKDAGLLDGTTHRMVPSMEEAEFALCVDLDFHGQALDEHLPALEKLYALNIPMICVNPDIEVVKQTGQHIWCAGALAQEYEKMGGEVSYFGKPHSHVYEATLELLGNPPRDKVLAVGDNIDTDIKGANNQQIDSALITGGILAREMPNPDPFALRKLCEDKDAFPTYVMPGFR